MNKNLNKMLCSYAFRIFLVRVVDFVDVWCLFIYVCFGGLVEGMLFDVCVFRVCRLSVLRSCWFVVLVVVSIVVSIMLDVRYVCFGVVW